jgi:DNA-binding CsgD family transcriptional regulator/PAS domain-containing protein
MPQAAGADGRLLDLIGQLYDAAGDDRLWAGIAGRIATVFESDSTVLKTHRMDGRVHLLEMTENLLVADRDRDWAEHWHRNDLWVERSVAWGLSRVVASHDLVAPEEEGRSAFYQEWLRRLGIHHMVGVVFPAGDGTVGVLGIHRPRGAGRYSEAARGKVEILLPHLQRALELGRRLASTSLAEAAALDALDRLDVGVLVVDRSRRVVHASAQAEAMLGELDETRCVNGCLGLRDPMLHSRFADMVREAVDTAAGHPHPPRAALAVAREERLPVTLAVAPLRPAWSRLGGQPALALVFLRDPERLAGVAEQLRALYGLTRAEAAVAAELARGRSLSDIAAAHRVGLATVRSHVKRVLAKTGTNRQAEAVALIAHSVAVIGGRE